ncbi:MAG: hypothetical protein GY707_14235 [Desulfobacteraceae bacterium]|nr:hypothetical protein [Desulfobacteraceae bacterium]
MWLIRWRENQAAELKDRRPNLKDKAVMEQVRKLEINSRKAPFYYITSWTLEKICEEDPTLMEKNFRAYIIGRCQFIKGPNQVTPGRGLFYFLLN